MRTKREQVQAHRFVIRRIVSGMVQGNPEALEFPMRRTAGSILGGLAIAVLVFAGFWVVGLLFGSADWKDQSEGAIIIDEETAAPYVYLDGKLYPVENVTSARLFLGSDVDKPPIQVSTADLVGVDRGDTFGIIGAPPAPVPAGDLVTLPWQVCSAPDQLNPKTQDSHITVAASAASDRLRDNALVAKADDEYFLIWNDLRFPVPDPEDLASVNLKIEDAVEVNKVFIEAIPAGPKFEKPDIGDVGDASERMDAKIGDFFDSAGGTYVLTPDGLAEVTQIGWLLLTGGTDPTKEQLTGEEIKEVGRAEVQSDSWPKTQADLGEPPFSGKGTICAVYDSSSSHDITVATYSKSKTPDPISKPTRTLPQGETADVSTADHSWTPPGKGALIREEGSPGAEGGTVYLVMNGLRFAIAGDDEKEALGYGGVKPTPVPSSLVALMPAGPALDQDEAKKTFTENNPQGQ